MDPGKSGAPAVAPVVVEGPDVADIPIDSEAREIFLRIFDTVDLDKDGFINQVLILLNKRTVLGHLRIQYPPLMILHHLSFLQSAMFVDDPLSHPYFQLSALINEFDIKIYICGNTRAISSTACCLPPRTAPTPSTVPSRY